MKYYPIPSDTATFALRRPTAGASAAPRVCRTYPTIRLSTTAKRPPIQCREAASAACAGWAALFTIHHLLIVVESHRTGHPIEQHEHATLVVLLHQLVLERQTRAVTRCICASLHSLSEWQDGPAFGVFAACSSLSLEESNQDV